MKKILLLTLLALCMPVITNASVASYNFSESETEKNEKDVAAPKDEMPTDDDLESLRMDLMELLEIIFSVLQSSEHFLMEKAPNYDYAPDLYYELYTYEKIIPELINRIEYASTMEELESCRQQLLELYSNLMQLQEKIEAFENPYFVAVTKEGVEMTFKIISKEDKTVQVGDGEWSAVSTRTIGEITIPEEVEGYRVIYIAENAFSDCRGMTSVTIPNSVTSIGQWAFYHCSGLTDVYCLAENTPTTDAYCFDNSPIESATLHVPAGSIFHYKFITPWSEFGNIVALTDEDGIGEVESSELKVESSIYDLDGRQMVNGKLSNGKWPRGINIIRYTDGTYRKVLVK